MKARHHISFLCGCFSMKKSASTISAIDQRWIRETKTKDEISIMEKFFYPEFVNFCYPNEGCIGCGMERYSMPIDSDIEVQLNNEKGHTISVVDLKLFVLPYDMLIYAIQVKQNGANLNDITLALSALRNISDYKASLTDGAWGSTVMQPIVEVFKTVSPDWNTASPNDTDFNHFNLMENGNKLKLFQILDLDEAPLDAKAQDQLLFELGTLAPIGSYNSSGFSSPSEEYFNKIMERNKISIFNNWQGLSLFDTFSILGYSTKPYLIDNWVNTYFGMIYTHSLFLKFYLFRMNVLFRKRAEKISDLEKEFLTFERYCCFHKISYNFLPLEIYNYLDTGLEISEERAQLYTMIEQEKSVKEKESDRKMNGFLFFLTCLTVFSTVWDFACLFNEIYPYQDSLGSKIFGYRLVTTALLLLVLFIILIYRLSGRKK